VLDACGVSSLQLRGAWNRANHARTMHDVGGHVKSFTAVPVRAEMSGSMLLSLRLLPQGHTFGCLPPQVLTPVKQALSAYKAHPALVMVACMLFFAVFIMAQTASRC